MRKMVEQIKVCYICGEIIYYDDYLKGYYCDNCKNLEVINQNEFK